MSPSPTVGPVASRSPDRAADNSWRSGESGSIRMLPLAIALIGPAILIAVVLVAPERGYATSTTERYNQAGTPAGTWLAALSALHSRDAAPVDARPTLPDSENPRVLTAVAVSYRPSLMSPFGSPVSRSQRQDVAATALQQLRTAGWLCPEILGSDMRLRVVRYLPAEGALQMTYSDGAVNASVFEQRGQLDASALSGYQAWRFNGGHVYTRPGSPAFLVWESEGRVFTVVTDAPLREVLNAIPVAPSPSPEPTEQESFFERLVRGLSRLGSWFNPFG